MRSRKRRWVAGLASGYLAVLVIAALAAPWIAGEHDGAVIRHDPGQPNAFARSLPPGELELRVLPLAGSDAVHRLGLSGLARRDDGTCAGSPVSPFDVSGPKRRVVGEHDFVLITASLQAFPVRIGDLGSPDAIADEISHQTGSVVDVRFDRSCNCFVLVDGTIPQPAHLLGTDRHGADVAANLVHAARTVILVALAATLIAFLLGVTVGSLMGALGGAADFLGLRLIEVFSAAPRLLILLIVAGALSPAYGRHMPVVLMAVIGLTTWMAPARLVRGEMMRVREQEFVLAAKATGARMRRVVLKHLLPHAIVPVLVEASFYMSAAVLLETNLSFLGLGVRPPGASWGGMLADAVDRSTGTLNWWLLAFPGAAVFLTILSIHAIGEWWRKRLGVKPAWGVRRASRDQAADPPWRGHDAPSRGEPQRL